MKVIGSKQDWQDFLAAFKEVRSDRVPFGVPRLIERSSPSARCYVARGNSHLLQARYGRTWPFCVIFGESSDTVLDVRLKFNLLLDSVRVAQSDAVT